MLAWLAHSYHSTRAARWLGCWIWLLLLLGSPQAGATNLPTPALNQQLNPDGTLRPGTSGSFDARGLRLYTAPDGQPVFRPAQARHATGVGDDQWRAGFGPAGADEKVLAVLRVGSDLYIGGQFTAVGNVGANHIARWDGSAWHALGTGPDNGTNGDVRALAAIGNTVYAGGNFGTAGGTTARYVAAWNGSTWQALGPAPALGVSNSVFALAALGNTLYVGGSFTQAGGRAVDFLASWNGTTWNSVGGGVDGTVRTLAADGSRLYVGGYFARAGTIATGRIACWDGTAWSALGQPLGAGSTVQALAPDGAGHLYAGGTFTQLGGPTDANVMRWDGTTWQALSTVPAGTPIRPVYALACSGPRLYAGGDFTQLNGVTATNIACWENGNWTALRTATASGVNAEVRALSATGADVWAGGHFFIAGEVGATYISHWTGTAWEAVGPGLGVHSYGAVYHIVAADSVLYVAGRFAVVGTLLANNVARWDGHAWSTLGTGPTNGTNGIVWNLLLDGSNLYAGGEFSQAGGVAARNIARWDGTRWQALAAGVDNAVYALAKMGAHVYAGGEFTLTGGRPTVLVNQWDGANWAALPLLNTWLQGSRVTALAVLGSSLIASGDFRMGNSGFAAMGLVQWDGTAWSNIGPSQGAPAPPYWGYPLAVGDGTLYVGGSIQLFNNTMVGPIARWNGSAWQSLAGPVSSLAQLRTLAVRDGNVYVGGFFYQTQLGTNPWPYNFVAKWNGRNWAALGTGLSQECRTVAPMSGGRLAVGGGFDATRDGSVRMLRFGIYADSLLPVLISATLGSTLPGAPLTLNGTNLTGATTVTFTPPGGTPITVSTGFVVNANGTQLAGLTVPLGLVTGLVTVTTPTGSSNGVLVQLYQPPTLTGVTPGSGLPGTALTLTGLNLTGLTNIFFTGPGGTRVPAPAGFVVNAAGTQITGLQVPAGAIPGPLTVITPGGTSSLPFAVPYPPVLTSLTPASTTPGTPLTLNGTNLTGASAVTFAGPGGAAVAVTAGFVVNATGTQVTGVVIPATAVSGVVTLTTPIGTSNGLPLALVLATRASRPAASLHIIPNPTTLYATVQVRPAPIAQSLVMLDATGRTVRHQLLPAHATTAPLEVAGLAKGLYLVRFGTATARLVVE